MNDLAPDSTYREPEPADPIRKLALSIGAALFIAIGAQLALPLPGTTVPLTLQTFFVLLFGAILGPVWGTLGVVIYLLAGAFGMPVFANGSAGMQHLLGPTGGFLLGFLGAAWLAGRMVERGWNRRFGMSLAAMLICHAFIFLAGLPWLAQSAGWQRAIDGGLLPFLPGAALKSLAVAALLWWAARRSEELQ